MTMLGKVEHLFSADKTPILKAPVDILAAFPRESHCVPLVVSRLIARSTES